MAVGVGGAALVAVVGYFLRGNVQNKGLRAVCVVAGSHVKGNVIFQEGRNILGQSMVTVSGVLTGLTPGSHGFHIHQLGDTTNGCMSTGESHPHFEPYFDNKHSLTIPYINLSLNHDTTSGRLISPCILITNCAVKNVSCISSAVYFSFVCQPLHSWNWPVLLEPSGQRGNHQSRLDW